MEGFRVLTTKSDETPRALRRSKLHVMEDDRVTTAGEPAKPAQPEESARAPELRFGVGISLAEAQREIVMATLEHFGGDKRRTAHVLGISLKTLYNRLGVHGDTRHVRRRSSVGGAAALKHL